MDNAYNQQAQQLAKAVEVAKEAYRTYPPNGLTGQALELMITLLEETKTQALNPEPEFKKISSLEYLTYDFLREFQEGSGETTTYFWKRIKEENLPYEQSNRLIQILKGKKIKSYSEYLYLTDTLAIALSNGLITEQEAYQLKVLAEAYQTYHSG